MIILRILLVVVFCLSANCALLTLPLKILTLPLQLLPAAQKALPYAMMFAEASGEEDAPPEWADEWDAVSFPDMDSELEELLDRSAGKIIFVAAFEVESYEDLDRIQTLGTEIAPPGARLRGTVVDPSPLLADSDLSSVRQIGKVIRDREIEMIVDGPLQLIAGLATSPEGTVASRYAALQESFMDAGMQSQDR